MRTLPIKLTLAQLNEWTKENNDLTSDKAPDIESYLNFVERAVPKQLLSIVRPLIIQEAVDPDIIVFSVVDEETNKTYYFNPATSYIFNEVYKPVVTDPSVLEGL